ARHRRREAAARRAAGARRGGRHPDDSVARAARLPHRHRRHDRRGAGADRAVPLCPAADRAQHAHRHRPGRARPGAGGARARHAPGADPGEDRAPPRAAFDPRRDQDFGGDQRRHRDHRRLHRRGRLRRAHRRRPCAERQCDAAGRRGSRRCPRAAGAGIVRIDRASFRVASEIVAPYRRPPDDAGSYPARWQGAPPAWLRGSVVRTCPAVFRLPGWQSEHLFDGLGAVFAFRIGDAPRLDWRLLDCEASRDARRGRSRLATFGTRMRRPWWLRLFQPVPRISDNVNVNIQPFAGALVAMTEAPKQARIDPQSLAVSDWLRYDDELGPVSMTAHPVIDREAGTVVNIAQAFGAKSECILYQHGAGDLRRRVLSRWPAREQPYVHSFGLTPRRAVLIGHPLTVRPSTMLWSEKPYIEHFRWRPERGTRLVLLDRGGGEPRIAETEACFVFHVANAYEEG